MVPSVSDAQRDLGSFNGTWDGTLNVVARSDFAPESFWRIGEEISVRIDISDESARVFIGVDDPRELRIGAGFRVSRFRSNAVIYSVQTAGSWEETWAFSTTKTTRDSLLVLLSFVAGGRKDLVEQITTEFAIAAAGEFTLTRGDAEGPTEN